MEKQIWALLLLQWLLQLQVQLYPPMHFGPWIQFLVQPKSPKLHIRPFNIRTWHIGPWISNFNHFSIQTLFFSSFLVQYHVPPKIIIKHAKLSIYAWTHLRTPTLKIHISVKITFVIVLINNRCNLNILLYLFTFCQTQLINLHFLGLKLPVRLD